MHRSIFHLVDIEFYHHILLLIPFNFNSIQLIHSLHNLLTMKLLSFCLFFCLFISCFGRYVRHSSWMIYIITTIDWVTERMNKIPTFYWYIDRKPQRMWKQTFFSGFELRQVRHAFGYWFRFYLKANFFLCIICTLKIAHMHLFSAIIFL